MWVVLPRTYFCLTDSLALQLFSSGDGCRGWWNSRACRKFFSHLKHYIFHLFLMFLEMVIQVIIGLTLRVIQIFAHRWNEVTIHAFVMEILIHNFIYGTVITVSTVSTVSTISVGTTTWFCEYTIYNVRHFQHFTTTYSHIPHPHSHLPYYLHHPHVTTYVGNGQGGMIP